MNDRSPDPEAARSTQGAQDRASGPPVPPKASIVIVSYNMREKLRACLDSVYAADGSAEEVIVVDNNSSDGSADLVASEYPQAILIRSGANLGFGAACNLAARHAGAPVLVFLNPDTRVTKGWLAPLAAALEGDAGAALATSKILLASSPERINTCGNAVHHTGLTLCRGLGLPRAALSEPEEVDAVSGASFAIRRTLFEKLGGFDEDAFLYMEDTDLSWRARLAGARCAYAPESIVLHEYELRITPRKTFFQERNRYLMLLKCLRWPTLLALAPALVLAEAVTWGFCLWGDRSGAANKLRAYAWIARNLGRILARRRTVQALRRIGDRELLGRTRTTLEFTQAGTGLVPRLAAFVFNPLFVLTRAVPYLVVWW